MSDRRIITKSKNIGIKLEISSKIYNNFLNKNIPNEWISIKVNVEINIANYLLLFDGFNDHLRVTCYKICKLL